MIQLTCQSINEANYYQRSMTLFIWYLK